MSTGFGFFRLSEEDQVPGLRAGDRVVLLPKQGYELWRPLTALEVVNLLKQQPSTLHLFRSHGGARFDYPEPAAGIQAGDLVWVSEYAMGVHLSRKLPNAAGWYLFEACDRAGLKLYLADGAEEEDVLALHRQLRPIQEVKDFAGAPPVRRGAAWLAARGRPVPALQAVPGSPALTSEPAQVPPEAA